MTKQAIRRAMLRRRRELSHTRTREWSLRAQQRIIDSAVFARSGSVALYSAIHNEVATDALFHAARQSGKQVCYPRIVGGLLEFFRVLQLEDLQPGTYGVATPPAVQERIVPPAAIDLMVVPGVAFDQRGYRLGYGRGYYDRCLAQSAGIAAFGLCYEFQLCPELPVEEHDRRVEALATEQRLIPCRQ